MENKINITELLKDAPKGTKLWCDAYGNVTLDKIDKAIFPISLYDKRGEPYRLTHNGSLYDYTPCILWPSKDCRTWENFKAPWLHKHFEPYQRVLVKRCEKWTPELYGYCTVFENGEIKHVTCNGNYALDHNIIPYKGNENLVGKKAEE